MVGENHTSDDHPSELGWGNLIFAWSWTARRALAEPNEPKRNFRGPRYVADLGGPRWLGNKMKKYIILANHLKERNQFCSVLI